MRVPATSAVWAAQFSERVKTLMERRRPALTLVKLAAASGVPYPSLYGYVVKRKEIPAYALVKIAQGLGVSVDCLAGVA